jgi:hypothetical protein
MLCMTNSYALCFRIDMLLGTAHAVYQYLTCSMLYDWHVAVNSTCCILISHMLYALWLTCCCEQHMLYISISHALCFMIDMLLWTAHVVYQYLTFSVLYDWHVAVNSTFCISMSHMLCALWLTCCCEQHMLYISDLACVSTYSTGVLQHSDDNPVRCYPSIYITSFRCIVFWRWSSTHSEPWYVVVMCTLRHLLYV